MFPLRMSIELIRARVLVGKEARSTPMSSAAEPGASICLDAFLDPMIRVCSLRTLRNREAGTRVSGNDCLKAVDWACNISEVRASILADRHQVPAMVTNSKVLMANASQKSCFVIGRSGSSDASPSRRRLYWMDGRL